MADAPLFRAIEIEMSTACNLKCRTCPNKDFARPYAELPTEVVERVLDELASLDFAGELSPHFYNEPLMDPRLPDILAMGRDKLPWAAINLFTNATLLDPDMYERLHPLVDAFIITTDEPAVKRAVDKLWAALPENRRDKLMLRSIKDAGISNRAGSVVMEGVEEISRSTCVYGVEYMTIDALGDVHLCCNDFFGQAVYGNVKENSLMEIWNSETYVRAREMSYTFEHPLCLNCYWR